MSFVYGKVLNLNSLDKYATTWYTKLQATIENIYCIQYTIHVPANFCMFFRGIVVPGRANNGPAASEHLPVPSGSEGYTRIKSNHERQLTLNSIEYEYDFKGSL